jgi:AcrR family transcriptional regulator
MSPEENRLAAAAPQFPQERARKTYEALIEAGAAAFAENGYDATHTPEIAARARVSVGTFYRYFSDKQEIFLEIMRRRLVHAQREILSRLTPERLAAHESRATIEWAVRVLFDHVEENPAMHRVFLEMSLRDDQVADLKRTFDDEARRRIAELIAAVGAPPAVDDPEATAFVIQTLAVETAIAMSVRREGPEGSRERILAAVTEAVYRAVFGSDR